MPDSPKKVAWMKENTTQATIRINHNTDKDILEYFGEKISATTIKAVLRQYMKEHPKEE